jgi:hypothetical protein
MTRPLLLCLFVSAAAAAPSVDDLNAGRRLTDQAKQAYLEGAHAEAADLYLSAWEKAEAPLLLKNALKILAVHVGACDRIPDLTQRYLATSPTMARAQEVAGYAADCLVAQAQADLTARRWAGAEAALRRAQGLPLSPPALAKVKAARARLEEAKAPVSIQLEVRGPAGETPTALALQVDGHPVTPAPDGALALPRGPHTVVAQAPDYEGQRLDFVAAPGVRVQVTLNLVPPAAPPPPASAVPRWAPWAAVGLAVAAGAGAVAMDQGGQSDVDALRAAGRSGTDRAAYDAARSDAESAQLWSTVLYAVAITSGAGAGALFYLAGDPTGSPEGTPAAQGRVVGWSGAW